MSLIQRGDVMSAKKNKQTKFRKIISYTITITCLAVFVYAAHGLIDILLDYYQNRKVINNVQDIYYQDGDSQASESRGEKGIRSGFDELMKVRSEVHTTELQSRGHL